jgi:oligopeptide transport system substrate-binding protein
LTVWKPGSKVVLEKSLQYRESVNVHFRTVTYISMPDSAQESRAFRSGNVDITDSIPDSELRSSNESSKGLQVGRQLSVVYYVFNVAKFPLKASLDLRRALVLAVDRTKLAAQLLGGGEVPALSFVPYGIAAYRGIAPDSEAGVERREVDLRLARFMYRRAGYSKSHPLSLVLLCPTNSSRRLVSVAVSEMWREALGVNVQLVYLDYRSYLAARSDPSRWDVISEGWNADFQDPINFLDIFSSTSQQNVYGFSDDVYDELLRRSASAEMLSERYKILASAEERLLEAQVVLPLYFPVTRRFVSRRIENAVISPMNHNYSKYWRATN